MAYAKVFNNVVVNVIVADSIFAQQHDLVEIPESVGKNWFWNGEMWIDPNPAFVDDGATGADSVNL